MRPREPPQVTDRAPGARLFVGNLDRASVSKGDIRRMFSKYGRIVEEILLFPTYGFVQFDSSEACEEAIRGENGRVIGDRRLDLAVAKDYGSSVRPPGRPSPPRGRSRSPDRRERHRSRSPPPRRPARRGGFAPCVIALFPESEAMHYCRRLQDMFRDQGIETFVCTLRSPDVAMAVERFAKEGRRYVCFVTDVHAAEDTVHMRQLYSAPGLPAVGDAPNLPARDACRLMCDHEEARARDPNRAPTPPPGGGRARAAAAMPPPPPPYGGMRDVRDTFGPPMGGLPAPAGGDWGGPPPHARPYPPDHRDLPRGAPPLPLPPPHGYHRHAPPPPFHDRDRDRYYDERGAPPPSNRGYSPGRDPYPRYSRSPPRRSPPRDYPPHAAPYRGGDPYPPPAAAYPRGGAYGDRGGPPGYYPPPPGAGRPRSRSRSRERDRRRSPPPYGRSPPRGPTAVYDGFGGRPPQLPGPPEPAYGGPPPRAYNPALEPPPPQLPSSSAANYRADGYAPASSHQHQQPPGGVSDAGNATTAALRSVLASLTGAAGAGQPPSRGHGGPYLR